jgi:hypothetical protein
VNIFDRALSMLESASLVGEFNYGSVRIPLLVNKQIREAISIRLLHPLSSAAVSVVSPATTIAH